MLQHLHLRMLLVLDWNAMHLHAIHCPWALIPTILISKDVDELESANDKATDANVKQCANDNAKYVHGCKCQTMCKKSNGQFENCCDADKGHRSIRAKKMT